MKLSGPDKKKPNFIFFVADQLRFDSLACAGHPVIRTPNIDRLAEEGVRFTRNYTVQPMCMATRSTLFTGLTPRGHGVRCNGIPLNVSIPTITDALRRSGYATHSVGKLHLNLWMPHKSCKTGELKPEAWPEAIPLWENGIIKSLPSPYYGIETSDVLIGKLSGHYKSWLLEREPKALELVFRDSNGFESVEFTPDIFWRSRLAPELHSTSWAAECAGKFLDKMAGERKPFFLWVSIPDPHPPFTVAEPYFSMYDPRRMPLPSRRENELDRLPPHYKLIYEKGLFTGGRVQPAAISLERQLKIASVAGGMVTQWDAMIGRIMEKLRETGMDEDTVVAVTSDHGQMLGDHWMQNMPPTHMDGTARVPSVWRCPGRFREGAVSGALISHLDFAPTVLEIAGVAPPEGAAPPEREAERERPALPGRSFLGILRGESYKIQDSVIIENDEDYLGMRQRSLITERYHITAYTGEAYGELFDLSDDPNQLCNQWDNPAFAGIKNRLLAQMMFRFAETDRNTPRRLGHA